MTNLYQATPERQLARQARARFVTEVDEVVVAVAATALARLGAMADQTGHTRSQQERRDAFVALQRQRGAWVEGVRHDWRKAFAGSGVHVSDSQRDTVLQLLGDEEVENKILASRLALAVIDKVQWELNDLRLRIQRLENARELSSGDVLKPEVLAGILVEQWASCGLSRDAWVMAQDSITALLVERMVEIYHHANEFLIQRGVMPEIDLKPLVKRTAGSAGSTPSRMDMLPTAMASGFQDPGLAQGLRGNPGPAAGGNPGPAPSVQGGGLSSAMGRAAEETRMLTAGTPLARARQRAQGVMGQLKRMLADRGADALVTRPAMPSPALAQALAQPVSPLRAVAMAGMDYSAADVEQMAGQLRQRSGELKRQASTASEKATIEIVALMFQSILAEERIPANVRVWFARLQMPVLRVALSEPEFFGTLQHPARQLIDRMGSCVLGFDASVIKGGTLEAEIKRIVQVIEQYPETGQRVFKLVFDEFQKFLSRFLTEQEATQRVVGVAQQLEQKETLAVQYTIELRDMLNAMPVRDEIREFLFKIWAEVLAVAAVKQGARHENTLALKSSATDLLWAASAKPNRNDRARVIQELPQLLLRLRQGMTMLGYSTEVQDGHIKSINDTLVDAFMSRTEMIPREQIDEMAKRLANLEEVVSEDETEDFPLDAVSLEMLLGIDSATLEVVADGGSQPSHAMVAWARELEPGNWFKLDHNGQLKQVQFVWRSDRKQLHLFASADGFSYLIQARRLAAYLQAGLLVPAEDEPLTVRATREALVKLNANPERLLG